MDRPDRPLAALRKRSDGGLWRRQGVLGVSACLLLGAALSGCGNDDTGAGGEVPDFETGRLRDASMFEGDLGGLRPDTPDAGGEGGAGGAGGFGGAGGEGGAGGGEVACTDGDTRRCETGCGMQTCTDGAFGECEGSEERCNGVDDDCDGTTDEDFIKLGRACRTEEGSCSSEGVFVCNAAGDDVACNAGPVESIPEVCDGMDNDCDSVVDEDFPGQACCTENYHCTVGATCVNGLCSGGGGGGAGGAGGGGGGQCLTLFDCDFFEDCVGGVCVPADLGCFDDSDCAPGEECDFFGECVPGAAPQAPVCDAPTVMNAPGVYRGSTNGLDSQQGASCVRRADGGEVVFTFTAAEAAAVTLTTEGSSFDTVLSVRTACANQGSEVACNDDDDALGTRSQVTFNATAGTTYFVIVDGYSGNGSVTLNYAVAGVDPGPGPDPDPNPDPDPDPNPATGCDACGAAEVCINNLCLPAPPAECRDALPADAEPSESYLGVWAGAGDTGAGSDGFVASCGRGARTPELMLAYAVEVPSIVYAVTDNADIDTILYVMSPCGTEISCNDDDPDALGTTSFLSFNAEPGRIYYIAVEAYDPGDSGYMELYVGHEAR